MEHWQRPEARQKIGIQYEKFARENRSYSIIHIHHFFHAWYHNIILILIIDIIIFIFILVIVFILIIDIH